MKHTDILIAGGGLVGMATAIALARLKLACMVVEKIPAPSQLEEAFDGRTSALNLGTKRLLANIGVWQHLEAFAEPITDIRVVEGYSRHFLHYDHREVGSSPFGWIVENRNLRKALYAVAEGLKSHLTLAIPDVVTAVENATHHATATLQSGEKVQAKLLLAADGRFSSIRNMLGVATKEWPYKQTAMVQTIAHSEPHFGLALERFLPSGPFAVLPMQNNHSSLVWSEKSDSAKHYLALPDEAFRDEIAKRIGGYLGDISLVGKRFSHPLAMIHTDRAVHGRVVLLGDASHGVHPIAGQGVNLGYRDVAALAHVLEDAQLAGLDMGADATLARYRRWRAFDTTSMVFITDGLTRLFSNNIAPLRLLRGMGLSAVGMVPSLKQVFMRHAMGVEGDLPRLME